MANYKKQQLPSKTLGNCYSSSVLSAMQLLKTLIAVDNKHLFNLR